MSLRKLQIVAATLLIYGSYSVWAMIKHDQPLILLWTVASYLAAAGLLLKKPWSRFLVYLVCSFTILGLLWYVAFMAANGWPYPGVVNSVKALAPATAVVSLCIWFMAVTCKFFHANKNQT